MIVGSASGLVKKPATNIASSSRDAFRHLVAFAVLAFEELVGRFGVAADELLRIGIDGQKWTQFDVATFDVQAVRFPTHTFFGNPDKGHINDSACRSRDVIPFLGFGKNDG